MNQALPIYAVIARSAAAWQFRGGKSEAAGPWIATPQAACNDGDLPDRLSHCIEGSKHSAGTCWIAAPHAVWDDGGELDQLLGRPLSQMPLQ